VSKIGGGAKDSEAHIANMSDESDKASADFGHNPQGWREYCPRALSRPEAKSCQRRMGFILKCALNVLSVNFMVIE